MACHLRTGFEWVALFGFSTLAICVLTWAYCRFLYPNLTKPEADHDESPVGDGSTIGRWPR
jgi:hypothetical protein